MKNIMKINFLATLTLLFLQLPEGLEAQRIKSASDFFPKERAKVLVVGTFHFNYPGLDAYKTGEDDKIDVLKEPKRSEVSELVAYIKQFNPTKIAIEARPAWEANEKLRAYKEGAYRDHRDERYQIGMRIANDLGIDTLYSLDVDPMSNEVDQLDKAYAERLWKGYDFQSDDPYTDYMADWHAANDQMIKEMNLLDYFKVMNSPESHQYSYGAYLIGDFKLDDQRGADILSFWWYNRNVRIFRKLQTITENPEDRILMLFGNGHAAVLRQLIEASPEYEFIEFSSL